VFKRSYSVEVMYHTNHTNYSGLLKTHSYLEKT